MSDSRHERLADVLVDFCAGVREGDLVTLESTTLAAPILRALYRRVLAAGAHPLPRISLEGMSESLLKYGNEEQLSWENPVRADDVETVDVRTRSGSRTSIRPGWRASSDRPSGSETAISSAPPPASCAGC